MLFPLFRSHLDLAHDYWRRLIQPGDVVIDATCGNGHDTEYLATLTDQVYGIDIQLEAIEKTRARVPTAHLIHGSHSTFPNVSPKLIVYNLGYLPSGDKSLTTLVDSTLESVQNGLKILSPGGALSITCYPGHPEGAVEEEALLAWSRTLDPKKYAVCFHQWLNRNKSPSLLFIQTVSAPFVPVPVPACASYYP